MVVDSLQSCVQYEDGAAYRAALLELEGRWFAPLQQALASGRVRRLCLQAPTAYGLLSWTSDVRAQWKLWLRPQTLQAIAHGLAATAA